MGSVKFECPYCKQHLEIDAAYAGTNCSCPVCQGEFIVPEPLPPEPVDIVPEPPADQGYEAPGQYAAGQANYGQGYEVPQPAAGQANYMPPPAADQSYEVPEQYAAGRANYMPPPAAVQGYEVPQPAVGRANEAANYSGYDDEEALRGKLSRTYITFRIVNAGVMVFPILVFLLGGLLSELLKLTGVSIGFLTLLGAAFLTWFVTRVIAWIYWWLLLYRIWALIPPKEAATTPGKAVGFQFIPFFNIYWNFIAYGELGKYLTARTGYTAPQTWATLYCWLPIIDIVVGIGFVAYLFMPLIDMAMMKSFMKSVKIWRNWN